MSELKFITVSMFCPKCGHKITGQRHENGALKLLCNRCKAAIFSKSRGEKEFNIKIVLQRSYV